MTNLQQLTCALNSFNFSGRYRRSRDRFLAAGEEDKDVLTLCEKRIYLFVLIFEMLFRLVSNLQSPYLCCFKIRLLDVTRCNEIFWLVVFGSYSLVSFWDTLSETILFLHVLLKCFPIKVILKKKKSSYIYHVIMCCYTVASLCCFSVRIKLVSIPTPLFLNSGLTLTGVSEMHSLSDLHVLPLLFPACHCHLFSLSSLSCWAWTSGFSWSSEKAC